MNKCGAPAVGGPCVLTEGHNMGKVDIPANHKAADPIVHFYTPVLKREPCGGTYADMKITPKGEFVDRSVYETLKRKTDALQDQVDEQNTLGAHLYCTSCGSCGEVLPYL